MYYYLHNNINKVTVSKRFKTE